MDEGDQFGDLKLGSSILRLVASTVFKGKKSINRADLENISPLKKDTFVYQNYQNVVELDSENDQIPLFGNQNFEKILTGIAERITPHLKEVNSKVETKKILVTHRNYIVN